MPNALHKVGIDLIVVLSTRKAKSRAQLTAMRTTVAYRGTKHFFLHNIFKVLI